ncbi:cation:proton antiporter [bacterium]|nr:cation:proton antiporter [bacterium]MCI0605694.1 cation:proton antiporter [bacterium]
MEHSITHEITLLILQLAFIIFIARIFGEIFERFLKQPAVLGELIAGVLFGPYLLGATIAFPGIGPLFPPLGAGSLETQSHIPIPLSLYGIAQIASILLLFVAGLETNLASFLRFAGKASVVGGAGIVLPFFLGAATTVWFGFADSFLDGPALFMGAIMAATSVGITARVLSDIKKLDTPEGITILGAAVVDDVLGILVLAIIVNLAQSGTLNLVDVGWIALKAIGIWVGLSAFFILLAPWLTRIWSWFRGSGSALVLTFFACLIAAVLCELVGLAMIIGAYSVGLAFSNTPIAQKLIDELRGVYHLFVPVFFVVLGMLVNIDAMSAALKFGLVISLFAILGKIVGCGIAGLGCGFNMLGAYRIGVGMVPRGEVALIIAGYGLTRGVVNQDMFGVAILMTLVTTVLAPVFLVRAFRNQKSGSRMVHAN